MTALAQLLNIWLPWVVLGAGVYILGGVVALGWAMVIAMGLIILFRIFGG